MPRCRRENMNLIMIMNWPPVFPRTVTVESAWWLLITWRLHDDVIKWKHFPRYWPFVRGIHRWPVNSPHKCQWRGALMVSLIWAWANGWVNNRDVGDLRLHRAHYDVTVMIWHQGSYNHHDGGSHLVAFGSVDEPIASCMMVHFKIYRFTWQLIYKFSAEEKNFLPIF